MPKEFDIRNYKSWDEVLLKGSAELPPNDLLQIRKFGKNTSLAADTPEDVWVTGGTKALPSATAETVAVVSDSANDDEGSTGAVFVNIAGVDGDYNLVSETVTMNGTSAVTTTQTFKTINRARVFFSGSNGVNVGTITCTGSTTSNVMATIPAGEGITQQSHFTVPAGYTCYTLDTTLSVYRASGTGQKTVEFDLMVHSPDANTTYTTLRYGLSSDGGIYHTNPQVVLGTPGKSTLWFKATASSDNTAVSTAVGYVLIKEDLNFRTEL